MARVITGRKGLLLYLVVVLGLLSAAVMTLFLLFSVFFSHPSLPPRMESPPIFGVLVVVVGIAICLWLAFANLAERTEVSLDKVVIRGPFGSHESLFRHVRSVEVLPLYGNTLFFGYNIVVLADLSQPGAKNHAINASIFANRHEIVKAVIEAAYRSNPEVRIDRSLLRSYGRPPYGIFGSTEVDA